MRLGSVGKELLSRQEKEEPRRSKYVNEFDTCINEKKKTGKICHSFMISWHGDYNYSISR